MFAIYAWNSGATQANILSDVIALLTGEIDKNNLSAACNKASSTIYAGYDAAGWTVHDAAAGTNRRVISAPCADGVYSKFIIVDTNTAGTLSFGGCESWNSTTKVGTNYLGGTMLPLANTLGYNSTSGVLLIYATQYGIYICFRTTGAFANFAVVCAEWQRDSIIQEVSKGYPCWGGCATSSAFNSNAVIYTPRRKNHTGTGDSVGSAAAVTLCAIQPLKSNNDPGSTSTFSRDSNEALYLDVSTEMYWSFASSIGTSASYGWAGKSRIDLARVNAGENLDELVIGARTYIRMCWQSTPGAAWVPRG